MNASLPSRGEATLAVVELDDGTIAIEISMKAEYRQPYQYYYMDIGGVQHGPFPPDKDSVLFDEDLMPIEYCPCQTCLGRN